MNIPLARSASITFTGTGQVQIGPTVFGDKWHVTSYSVLTDNPVLGTTQIQVYIGNPTGAPFDQSSNGDMNTSQVDLTLNTLDVLTFVWSNGAANTTGTATVYGEQIR